MSLAENHFLTWKHVLLVPKKTFENVEEKSENKLTPTYRYYMFAHKYGDFFVCPM
jgi:hypothetical protein